ncbi:hypothetical protein [Plantactinospora sonchi]|uniref:DUF4231 domain-containing protein n=1 Tax=Plantactinospora sonchi TaxID=1544735 RepID=A0ABU7RNR1_9ACTN
MGWDDDLTGARYDQLVRLPLYRRALWSTRLTHTLNLLWLCLVLTAVAGDLPHPVDQRLFYLVVPIGLLAFLCGATAVVTNLMLGDRVERLAGTGDAERIRAFRESCFAELHREVFLGRRRPG